MLKDLSRVAMAGVFIAAGSLVGITPAYAARIYNFTNTKLTVQGGTHSVTLSPGQRSASLEWTNSTDVYVPGANVDGRGSAQLCGHSGVHELIVGGNYLVVSQSGHELRCTLCNASHSIIFDDRESNAMPDAYTSSHQGC